MSAIAPTVKKDSEMTIWENERRDSNPTVLRCALCPSGRDGDAPVIFEGRHDESLVAAKAHRADLHPEAIETRRSRYGQKRACSRPDCVNPVTSSSGRFAGLCAAHRDEEKANEAREKAETARRERELDRADRDRKRAATASRNHPLRRINDSIRDQIVHLYVKGELSAGEIAKRKYKEWGYASTDSCTAMVYEVMKQRGVPRRSREEANALGRKHGYHKVRPRQKTEPKPRKTRLTPARLELLTVLFRADCSLRMIAREVHEKWGYKTAASCETVLGPILREQGFTTVVRGTYPRIPTLSRDEALALIAAAG